MVLVFVAVSVPSRMALQDSSFYDALPISLIVGVICVPAWRGPGETNQGSARRKGSERRTVRPDAEILKPATPSPINQSSPASAAKATNTPKITPPDVVRAGRSYPRSSEPTQTSEPRK